MKRLICLILVLTTVLSMAACKGGSNASSVIILAPPTTPSSSGVILPVTPATGPLYDRKSYTVTDEVAKAAIEKVIGSVGDDDLTNGLLQIAYWSTFFKFLDDYSSLPFHGLTYQKPLDEQETNVPNQTAQHYFLREALNQLHRVYAMSKAFEDAGMTIPQDLQNAINAIADLAKKDAEENGFDNVLDYVQLQHGAGSTPELLYAYLRMTYISDEYYRQMSEKLLKEPITREILEKYYEEHKGLALAGVSKDDSIRVHRIRHILIYVEGEETEADWDKAKNTAQGLLNQWLAGDKTEDSFANLALNNSQDSATLLNGGLCGGMTTDNTVDQPFKDWYLDPSRQSGDYDLIKTKDGYHVMYYVKEEAQWEYETWLSYVNALKESVETEALEKYPMEIDYTAIALGYVDPSKLISYGPSEETPAE